MITECLWEIARFQSTKFSIPEIASHTPILAIRRNAVYEGKQAMKMLHSAKSGDVKLRM